MFSFFIKLAIKKSNIYFLVCHIVDLQMLRYFYLKGVESLTIIISNNYPQQTQLRHKICLINTNFIGRNYSSISNNLQLINTLCFVFI